MGFQGSLLTHPIQPDHRGTLGTTSNRLEMIAESLASIIETRQGERVMVPDYGVPDFVFGVMDAGFSARLAFFLEQQIRRYEPLVERVRVKAGALVAGEFVSGLVEDLQQAAVAIEYTVRGENTPRNLVYPVWRLRERA